jgi:alkanesulfonate monooxygenase SsuD/methylene tetrahydromethanopterin reductase-like flavin-dependent oxidoreductase (luciferase family)
VRIGITLPTFSPDATGVIAAARAAEANGLHGVFVFDHLWPIGDPSRPAMSVHPTTAAVLASTEHISVGTLVSRIGLLPEEVVMASLLGLHNIAGGRFIAGIGTGDKASADENVRLGIAYQGATARRAALRRTSDRLRDAGVDTWIGGGALWTNDVARDAGATLNLWGAPPEKLRAEIARGGTVSWAGPLAKDRGAAIETLRATADAGATWAVWGWPESLAVVAEVAVSAGIGLGPASK